MNIIKRDSSVLFYIALVGLFFLVIGFTYFLLGWDRSVKYSDLTLAGRVISLIGILGFIGFWFSVLIHFFKNAYLQHKVLWGFALIFFSWLSSLIYFFVYMLPGIKSSEYLKKR